jgi:MFS family permease
MRVEPYRQVLIRPGVRPLLVVALLARVAPTAAGLTLTLHVVLDLHRGYAAAGLVGAVSTVGIAIGGPLLGRFVDRRGLRPMLLLTTAAEVTFWASAPELSYPVLLVVAFVAGALMLPVFTVVRQSLAALVPADQRRTAYSIDSMSVEMSYMAGPALAVLVVTTASATIAMWAVGAATLLSGVGLFLLNPATASEEEAGEEAAGERTGGGRRVLHKRMVVILAAAAAATFVLSGTDVGIVALLRESDQLRWSGLVFIAWGGYSLVGGFIYGAVRNPLPSVVIIGLMGLCTIPLGLIEHWPWLMLALLPAGLLCAPSLASSADLVSKLAPASVRGEAMGWYGSALTVGLSLGAPAVGAVVDRKGPGWAFAVAGALGAAIALTAWLALRGSSSAALPVNDAEPASEAAPSASGP